MIKQECIAKAYGNYADIALGLCDENGWIKAYEYYTYFPQDKEKTKERNGTDTHLYFRPKFLQGIEHNHNWIKIESEADLPKENGVFWIFDKDLGIKSGEWKQAPNEIEHKKACDFWIKRATHYQPIEKPKPPIY